jgi:hypothetical protein
MTDLPDVKLKALISFPATVNGGTGIGVVQANGVYTFNLATDELALVGSVAPADAPATFLMLWNSTTGSYSRISLTNLKTTLAALP